MSIKLSETNKKFLSILKQVENANLTDAEFDIILGRKQVVLDRHDKNITCTLDKADKPDNIPVGFKHCYICGIVKSEEDFYKKQSRCKKCHHVYHKLNPNSRKYRKP